MRLTAGVRFCRTKARLSSPNNGLVLAQTYHPSTHACLSAARLRKADVPKHLCRTNFGVQARHRTLVFVPIPRLPAMLHLLVGFFRLPVCTGRLDFAGQALAENICLLLA